ncbi:MAG: lipid A export permease/ATP-binding protein MsbA [Thermodesulfobacteriota bacterium]
MKLYLKLIAFVKPYWLRLLMAVICMSILAMTTAMMAYLIGPVMKFLFIGEGDGTFRVIPTDSFKWINNLDMMVLVPILIIFVALLKGLSFYGQAYFMGYVGQRIVTDLRDKLYSHLQSLSLSFYNKTSTGILLSRLTNDVNLIQGAATNALASLMRDSFTILALMGVAVFMDWRLSIVAFIVFPLSVIPLVKFGKRMRRASTQSQTTMGVLTSILQETLTGIRIVKAFGMEPYEKKRFKAENQRLFRVIMKTVKVRALSPPFMELLGMVCLAVSIWYAALRINRGELTPEAFISFFAAVLMLYQPVRKLSNVNNSIQQGLAAAERVFGLMDIKSEIEDRVDAIPMDEIKEGIEFKKVSFKYDDTLVLKEVAFKVRRGEILAIVGMSGAGKSTMVDLIPRFYDVGAGQILFDGVDVRDITLKSLRSMTSIVSQQTILFNDTARNNIAYGDPAKKDEEIVKAAKAANAHKFIMGLPNDYDTIIGEQGVKLSGGERQRLSIARAILKDSPILILDEATSSLDAESEREVQMALLRLMEGRTTFVIAHRLSTIRHADTIIVLSNGNIVERGRHEDLLRQNGEYSKFYTLQFRNDAPPDNFKEVPLLS